MSQEVTESDRSMVVEVDFVLLVGCVTTCRRLCLAWMDTSDWFVAPRDTSMLKSPRRSRDFVLDVGEHLEYIQEDVARRRRLRVAYKS